MKAEYVDHMGDDLRVVNAARVSFNKESDWLPESQCPTDEVTGGKIPPYFRLSERDTKLIKYLAEHGHWTPFSHPQITMREKVPIFVARQRFKHMVGFTYNEVSRRYVDDEPEFYKPDVWRSKASNKKQGSSDEVVEDTDEWAIEVLHEAECALDLYKNLLTAGVCPEQARMVLPQSMYTEYYVTGSLAAWARAYKLRSSTDSQKEIQELAGMWHNIIQPLFPVSWKELTK